MLNGVTAILRYVPPRFVERGKNELYNVHIVHWTVLSQQPLLYGLLILSLWTLKIIFLIVGKVWKLLHSTFYVVLHWPYMNWVYRAAQVWLHRELADCLMIADARHSSHCVATTVVVLTMIRYQMTIFTFLLWKDLNQNHVLKNSIVA